MRKLFTTIVLLAMLGTMPVMAQSDGDFVILEKANVVTLGPRLGATFTTMSQPSECDLYDGAGMGVSFGAALKARFGRATKDTQQGGTGLLGFGLDLMYKQNNVKTIGSDDLSLGYFEIPVTLHVYPMVTSKFMNTFYVEAGPSLALLSSKSPALLSVPSANVSYHTGDLKGGDLRAVVGLGYTFPKTGLDINARYYIGTSELAGNFPCKQNSLEVSLSWQFKIATF
ncbi:MAG: outer membrane beta-barrel protein [Prevotella sp.]|nr:outer membrane beta-barrel protein [Prevotella sp.]